MVGFQALKILEGIFLLAQICADWSRLVFGVTVLQIDVEYLLKLSQVKTFFIPCISPSLPCRNCYQSDVHSKCNAVKMEAVCRRRIASHSPARGQLEEPFLYNNIQYTQ